MDVTGNIEIERLISEMLSEVAEQLRDPLSTVFECLGVGTATNDAVPPLARKSYYRLLRIIGNMSAAENLSNPCKISCADVDLAELCGELCESLAPALEIEQGVALEFLCAKERLVLACERTMMERLLLNLFSNSAKFTPRGGRITVELKDEKPNAILSVTDTGCGIPPERLERLFSHYAQTGEEPRPHEGLGLGLPICRRIAEGHGGRIFVESGAGGTKVTVAIPNRRSGIHNVEEPAFDYAGGYNHVLMEMSDVLGSENYEI